jgi:hypothetical protein
MSQAESDVFATTGGDRSIALYDLRSATPIRKLVMQRRSNTLAWNPMEAFNFTAANEDCNLYTYDMRKLDTATCVHQVRPMARGTRDGGSEGNVCWVTFVYQSVQLQLLVCGRACVCHWVAAWSPTST